ARHARRLLQERVASGGRKPAEVAAIHELLAKLAFEHKDETRRLRGLWALHVTGGLTEARVLKALKADGKNEYVRAWAVQLALEDRKPSDAVSNELATLATRDLSPVIQLYLASAAQRLPAERSIDVFPSIGSFPDVPAKNREALYADPNLPLMYWYAAERRLAYWGEKKDFQNVELLLGAYQSPRMREFMIRRL